MFSLNTTKLGDKPKPVKASREPPSTVPIPYPYFAFACRARNRLISAKGGGTKSLLTPRPFGISNSHSFAMIFEHFIVSRNNACAWPTVFNRERKRDKTFASKHAVTELSLLSWRGTIVAWWSWNVIKKVELKFDKCLGFEYTTFPPFLMNGT